MKNNYIEAEQLLFGYSNGHHLLDTSILLSERTQKTLEVLSDLSGPYVQSGFTEYITGYPLQNDNYYALSKTWYAPEMKRPGCVWTHMLLFKYNDLDKIKYCKDLLGLFKRPDLEVGNSKYSTLVEIEIDNDKNVRADINISMDRLKFIEWAVYTNDEPIIIPAITAGDYVNEILEFWLNQDKSFMKTFSFCTGVLANRKIEKKAINFQVVPNSLLRSISRQNKEAKVLDMFHEKVNYPIWIDYMFDHNRQYIMRDFDKFRSCYGNKYLKKRNFNKFATLFVKTGIMDGKADIRYFLESISDIFVEEEEEATKIKNITVQQLLENEHLKWFDYNTIIDVILDLSIEMDLTGLDIECISIDKIIDILWKYYPNKLKYILERLINDNINLLGKKLIKGFALKISPDQLPEFTNMNLELCKLMVELDYKFALCLEIWNQTRDFQLEILNCIEINEENIVITQQILTTILQNTSEDLCYFIYNKFGDIAIDILLDWNYTTPVSDDRKEKWMGIFKKNPIQCIKWMRGKGSLKDISLFIRIISEIDPWSDEMIQVDINIWIDSFYNLDLNRLNNGSKFILAQFFMPIILLKKDLFPNDFAKFVFSIINIKIAEEDFNIKDWEKLEKLLPEAAWYFSWDKCKRLRKAMIQKGYKV